MFLFFFFCSFCFLHWVKVVWLCVYSCNCVLSHVPSVSINRLPPPPNAQCQAWWHQFCTVYLSVPRSSTNFACLHITALWWILISTGIGVLVYMGFPNTLLSFCDHKVWRAFSIKVPNHFHWPIATKTIPPSCSSPSSPSCPPSCSWHQIIYAQSFSGRRLLISFPFPGVHKSMYSFLFWEVSESYWDNPVFCILYHISVSYWDNPVPRQWFFPNEQITLQPPKKANA